MMNRTHLLALTTVALAGLSLAGCTAGGSTAQGSGPGGNSGDARTRDVNRNTDDTTARNTGAISGQTVNAATNRTN